MDRREESEEETYIGMYVSRAVERKMGIWKSRTVLFSSVVMMMRRRDL